MDYELQALLSKFGDNETLLPIGSVFKIGKILGVTGHSFQEIEAKVVGQLSSLSNCEVFINPKLEKALQNAEKAK